MSVTHITLPVKDVHKSFAFYEAALKPLGYTKFDRPQLSRGMGGFCNARGVPDFMIKELKDGSEVQGVHAAFAAKSHEDVDAWYKACLDAGAKDNGPPGLRVDYHPNFYAAFVVDPDGHRLEACYCD
eukprot:jgi/Chlat1/3678/Chrsp24S03844